MSLIDDVARIESLLEKISGQQESGIPERESTEKTVGLLSEFRGKLSEALQRVGSNAAADRKQILELTGKMKQALVLVSDQSSSPVLRTLARSGVEFLAGSSDKFAKECAEVLVLAPLVDLGSAFEKVHASLRSIEIQSVDNAAIRSQELRELFTREVWPSIHSRELRDRALTYWQTCQAADGVVNPPEGFDYTGTWQSFRDKVEQRLTASDIVSRTGEYKELASRIAEVNSKLEQEIKELGGIIRTLKIISAFIDIALSVISLTAPPV